MHLILYPNGQSLEHCTSDAEKKKKALLQAFNFCPLLKIRLCL